MIVGDSTVLVEGSSTFSTGVVSSTVSVVTVSSIGCVSSTTSSASGLTSSTTVSSTVVSSLADSSSLSNLAISSFGSGFVNTSCGINSIRSNISFLFVLPTNLTIWPINSFLISSKDSSFFAIISSSFMLNKFWTWFRHKTTLTFSVPSSKNKLRT